VDGNSVAGCGCGGDELPNEECLSELFAKDAVSVEPFAFAGQDRTSRGVDAIRAKGEWWTNNHTIHGAEVDGPYPHDDRFAVQFTYDVTFKPENKRFTMNEVGLFTVKDGENQQGRVLLFDVSYRGCEARKTRDPCAGLARASVVGLSLEEPLSAYGEPTARAHAHE
jgi:hypothetical protein